MRRCAKCGGPLGSRDVGIFCNQCYEEFLRSIIGTIPCPKCVLGHIEENLSCTRCRRRFILVEEPAPVPAGIGTDD